MLDPKGDMPWNEDPLAQDISHLSNQKVSSAVWMNANAAGDEYLRISNVSWNKVYPLWWCSMHLGVAIANV